MFVHQIMLEQILVPNPQTHFFFPSTIGGFRVLSSRPNFLFYAVLEKFDRIISLCLPPWYWRLPLSENYWIRHCLNITFAPAGNALTSDLFINSFIIVVFGEKNEGQSEFTSKARLKIFLIAIHYKLFTCQSEVSVLPARCFVQKPAGTSTLLRINFTATGFVSCKRLTKHFFVCIEHMDCLFYTNVFLSIFY